MRHALHDQFRELHLEAGRNAETRAATHHIVKRVEHHRCRVAQHQRAPAQHVVDVAIAIDVPDVGAFAALHHERFTTHAAERTHRRVYAARKQLACARHHSLRFRRCNTRHRHRPKLPIEEDAISGNVRDACARGDNAGGSSTSPVAVASKS